MAEERAKFGRVMWVAERIRSGSKPSARTLAEEYETSRRTIKRDIEYLRTMLGAPIEYDAASNGYYYSEDAWDIASVQLSEHELFSITIAADVLDAYRNSPLHGDLRRIFQKITSHLPEKVSVSPAQVGERFSVFHQAVSTIPAQTWERVMQGLRECRTLRFGYTAAGYTTSVRKSCEPYHCIGYRGEWYLVGRDVGKDDLRVFALSRMNEVKVSSSTFTIPEDFRVEDYVDPAFGIHLNDELQHVHIHVEPHLAVYFRERTWHETQEITDNEDGSLELRFRTNQLNAVRFWVQSWGPGAAVVEPEALRAQIRSDLEEALELYSAE